MKKRSNANKRPSWNSYLNGSVFNKLDLEIWSLSIKTLHNCLHCPLLFIGNKRRNCCDGMCEAIKDKDAEAIEFYLRMHNEICEIGEPPGISVIKEWISNMKDNESEIIKTLIRNYETTTNRD